MWCFPPVLQPVREYRRGEGGTEADLEREVTRRLCACSTEVIATSTVLLCVWSMSEGEYILLTAMDWLRGGQKRYWLVGGWWFLSSTIEACRAITG